MTKNIPRITLLALLTAALVALPALTRAQDSKPKPPASSDQTEPGKPKKHGVPFNGKVAAVDAKAMTLTVGTMVIHVTADTKITKDGQPATLADAVVGEKVGGAYQKTDDGKLNATVVHFGAKAGDMPDKEHKHPSDAGDKK